MGAWRSRPQSRKNYGENMIGQFANDINFPGSAKTLKRYRDVCRAFPENAGRPAFLTAAQALASHPDRHEIFKQKPNLTQREARQLMHTYSQQISSAENQKAGQPAFSRPFTARVPEITSEPPAASVPVEMSEPSGASVQCQ